MRSKRYSSEELNSDEDKTVVVAVEETMVAAVIGGDNTKRGVTNNFSSSSHLIPNYAPIFTPSLLEVKPYIRQKMVHTRLELRIN